MRCYLPCGTSPYGSWLISIRRSSRPSPLAQRTAGGAGGTVLTAFARAFKTPDLRKKLLFTLAIIVLFRLGQHVPIPGIDYKNVQTCMDLAKGQQGLFGLVNMFSGGA